MSKIIQTCYGPISLQYINHSATFPQQKKMNESKALAFSKGSLESQKAENQCFKSWPALLLAHPQIDEILMAHPYHYYNYSSSMGVGQSPIVLGAV